MNKFLGFLGDHYGKELAVKSVEREEFALPALVSFDIHTEWMIFRRYITNRPKEDIMKLLIELAINSMLVQVFPHLSDLAKVCLLIPVGTASVKKKLLPNEDDQNKAKESFWRAPHLMRIAIEMPEKLPDDIVENVVDI